MKTLVFLAFWIPVCWAIIVWLNEKEVRKRLTKKEREIIRYMKNNEPDPYNPHDMKKLEEFMASVHRREMLEKVKNNG